MNRRLILIAIVAVLALLGLWIARTADATSTLRARQSLPEFVLDLPGRAVETPGPSTLTRDFALVTCTVDDPRRDVGSLVARSESGELKSASATDRVFSLALAPGEWTLTWLGFEEARALGTLDLYPGDIERCHLSERWNISGYVENQQGKPLFGVDVVGCGGVTSTDETGKFTLSASNADCEIQAVGKDGVLQRRSDGFPFSPFDETTDVRLLLDDDPIGGIGVVISSVTEGMRVDDVREDTPAEDAGLQSGDVLLTVDGQSTEGWGVETATAAITGVPGTIVRLEVLRETQELTLSIRRERL